MPAPAAHYTYIYCGCKGHVYLVDIDINRRVTDCAQRTAPVGVCTKDGGFHQRRADDRFGNDTGLFLAARAGDGAFD